MLQVNELTVDYLENPAGVQGDSGFGWIVESNKRNVLQKAYQVQIFTDEIFNCAFYDSMKIYSGESVRVKLHGWKPLPMMKYSWRVKIWDQDGEESEWSKEQQLITGVPKEYIWKAGFITAESPEDAGISKGTCVRNTFILKDNIKYAVAAASAFGIYKLFINGLKIGKDELTPGWTSYHKHLLYQTYNVTEYLKAGANSAGAMLGAGWYKGIMGFLNLRNNYGDRTAFFCEIRVFYEDGSSEIIGTDHTWKGCDSPVLFSEIYDGEIYDARLEMNGYSAAGFDDSGWKPVEILPCNKRVLSAQKGCAVREMESLPAIDFIITPKGERVIDFGQNLTGWVQFKTAGRAGDRVVLKHFEVLDKEGNVYLDNLRRAKQTVTYILKGNQEESFHPNFTFQGFRYVKIEEYPGVIEICNFTAKAVYSNMRETGTFLCSNPDLNQLQHNILWGLKGNFVDVPTDCPQRNERLGWTGDAQIFCGTACYLMNAHEFYRKWLVDVEADQTEEGGVPHVVPDILTGKKSDDWLISQGSHSASAWADAAVINPFTLYLRYGDTRILEDQFKSMKAWIDFMRAHSENGIWTYKLQFGDWVALDAKEGSYFGATPGDLTCTAYFAYSSGLFAKICNILGKVEWKEYSQLHEEVKGVFCRTFFRENGEMSVQTQTSHILALYFDLVPEQFRRITVDNLIRLLEEQDGHLVTGFVGTPYFCHVLSQNGHTKEAYELLLKDDFPSWLYQVRMGATTVWEHWDGIRPDGTMWSPDMNSFNHYAYGAVGEWMYRAAAGIETDEACAGYRHSIIHPHIGGGLTFVEASYESVYGMIKVRWENTQELVSLFVTVPHNTTATIILDFAENAVCDSELEFVEDKNGLRVESGSGSYHISYCIKDSKDKSLQ